MIREDGSLAVYLIERGALIDVILTFMDSIVLFFF